MDMLRIVGGVPLSGVIRISGAKNAALPLMAAALLTDEALVLHNVPKLADISTMTALLAQHGTTIDTHHHTLTLHTKIIISSLAPYDLVRKMRASVLVLGPLLARHGNARVSLPGGCAIGTRPVDLHIMGLEKLGASIRIDNGYMEATAPENGLRGAEIVMPMVSVGATENLLMAASLAEGETILRNAAREPEITNLAQCLVAMGARIEGIGTDTLCIHGVASLHGATHTVIPDRIETGTYAVAAAMTGGELTLTNTNPKLLGAFLDALRRAGCIVDEDNENNCLSVSSGGRRPQGVDVMTEPHPGFPTDLQAQFMALMALSEGAALITETIFENRFMHVPELCRMGAKITVHHASALVRGVPSLTGAPVMASDLRASAALVLAGLMASGETQVHRLYHLDRGYERMVEKLQSCGARLHREREDYGGGAASTQIGL
ncbi:MAG: UDP-N-acetylglucosamine 1-carboxyvinyltransferase [Holosporales bacterium]